MSLVVIDADAHSTGTVQVYNPTTNTWTLAPALPIAVNHNAAAVVGGKLYSFGAGQDKRLLMIPTTTPGLPELPAITCTAEPPRWE